MSDDLDTWLDDSSVESASQPADDTAPSSQEASSVEAVQRERPWINRTLTPRPGRTSRARRREPAPPPLAFGNVAEWVEQWLAPTYRRQVGPQLRHRWDPRWWESAEGISRLEALWRAWECLRLDPGTGMAVWWRDYADPFMSVLLSPDGPFGTSEATNKLGDPLPCTPPPPVMFPDERV